MSQQLVLELSDEVYNEISQRASAVGLPLSEWVIVELGYSKDKVAINSLSDEQQEEARRRFRSHAGSVNLGYSTGVDNEGIDADLAKAYANEY